MRNVSIPMLLARHPICMQTPTVARVRPERNSAESSGAATAGTLMRKRAHSMSGQGEYAHVVVGQRQLHESRAAADGAANVGDRVVFENDRVQLGELAKPCKRTSEQDSHMLWPRQAQPASADAHGCTSDTASKGGQGIAASKRVNAASCLMVLRCPRLHSRGP